MPICVHRWWKWVFRVHFRSFAASSIPRDSMPRIFAGLRFATITIVTKPVNHGDSGIFDVKSLPGAICYLHRDGAGSNKSGSNFAIPAAGDSGSVSIGGTGDSTGAWPASAGGYAITAVCTMPAPDNRTVTSSAVAPRVVWP